MGKKILVVDDEPDFVEMIKLRLESSGYDVITASDGKGALEKIKDEKPDAVLLDIMMPGLNGLQVLKKIRKRDKNLPVFIVTAFSNEERFNLAEKLDASGFIVKTNDLKEELANIFSASRMADKYKGAKKRDK
ncbi:MAG: two-component system response regulator [Candidatus Omnitrophica bacterium CG07_land_8_20_14_0_80_42_15]|uniref:Two-component system response regulator n=1 Tax=Candidatus Aquitaenariimonas noxiae TaxID=1974741 RepID=A0A2J0KYI6_9BACT|nr:MAG: two-component system response regulator [Candidatus Omnitrophica bacterium CG07_land_8_20_14_0_80_42_15]